MKGLFDEFRDALVDAINELETNEAKGGIFKEMSKDYDYGDFISNLNKRPINQTKAKKGTKSSAKNGNPPSKQAVKSSDKQSNSMFKPNKVGNEKSFSSGGKKPSKKKIQNSREGIGGNSIRESASLNDVASNLEGKMSEIESREGELTALEIYARNVEASDRMEAMEREKQAALSNKDNQKIISRNTVSENGLNVDSVALEIVDGFRGEDRLLNAKKAFLYNEIFNRRKGF